ncbi:Hypothetical protein GLP15_4250 [Giardia lamblia P15]|uniref:Uncharacterized protein n=1 Tax=Giardia intestinalis (strain P15) TaxID=658858 RepID=E1EY04_GIAIA|nr:Hypothetical protein GLP15_4250 [Giardia lamblia P15]
MIVDIPKHSLLDILNLIYPTLQENGEALSDTTLAELTESTDRLALLLLDDITMKPDDKKMLREHKSLVGGNHFSTSPRIRHLFFSLAAKSTLYDKSSKAYTELSALLYLYALLTFASSRTQDTYERKRSFVQGLVPCILSSHLSGNNIFLASFYELALTVNSHVEPHALLKARASISVVQTSVLLLQSLQTSGMFNIYIATLPPSVSLCIELLFSCWKSISNIQERRSTQVDQFATAELFEYTLSFLPAPSPQALKLFLDTYIGWSMLNSRNSVNEVLLSHCLSFYSEAANRSFQEIGDGFSLSCLLQFLIPIILTGNHSLSHDILIITLRSFTSALSQITTLAISSPITTERYHNSSKPVISRSNNIAPIFVNSLLIIEDVENALPQLVYGVTLFLLYALVDWDNLSKPEFLCLEAYNLSMHTHLRIRPLGNRFLSELYPQIIRFYIWMWHVRIVVDDVYQLIDVDLPQNIDSNVVCVDELNAREIYTKWFERLPILDDLLTLKHSECSKDMERQELDLMGGAQLGLLILRRSIEATLRPITPSFRYYVRRQNLLTKRNIALLDCLTKISN